MKVRSATSMMRTVAALVLPTQAMIVEVKDKASDIEEVTGSSSEVTVTSGQAPDSVWLREKEEEFVKWRDEYKFNQFYSQAKTSIFDFGYKMTKEDQANWRALMHACAANNAMIVTYILEKYPDLDINQREQYNQTPLWIACFNNSQDVVKLLLQHATIDVNKANRDGWAPIWIAAMENHSEVIELLLEHPKIDMNQTAKKYNFKGMTPLDVALKKQHRAVLSLLNRKGAKYKKYAK